LGKKSGVDFLLEMAMAAASNVNRCGYPTLKYLTVL
jgi:hypothetical protein